MQSTAVKTILIWVLIIVVAMGLYTFVDRGPIRKELNLTEFLNKVKGGEVSEVTINGSKLTGKLAAGREPFVSTIPQDYNTVYDILTQADVRITVMPPEQNPWLGLIATGGAILWLAISVAILVLVVDLSRFVKRELARARGNPSATQA